MPCSAPATLGLILGLASVIMVMGLVDDLKDLDWRLRLGIQFACAAALAAERRPRHALRTVHPPAPRAARSRSSGSSG